MKQRRRIHSQLWGNYDTRGGLLSVGCPSAGSAIAFPLLFVQFSAVELTLNNAWRGFSIEDNLENGTWLDRIVYQGLEDRVDFVSVICNEWTGLCSEDNGSYLIDSSLDYSFIIEKKLLSVILFHH